MVIELLDINVGPKTPADVKAPPKDATVDKDGLAYKILTRGTAAVHPTKTNSVTVKYAGWTTDGKQFDSSYDRGQPATFSVGGVIPGWTEALQEMVVGEEGAASGSPRRSRTRVSRTSPRACSSSRSSC